MSKFITLMMTLICSVVGAADDYDPLQGIADLGSTIVSGRVTEVSVVEIGGKRYSSAMVDVSGVLKGTYDYNMVVLLKPKPGLQYADRMDEVEPGLTGLFVLGSRMEYLKRPVAAQLAYFVPQNKLDKEEVYRNRFLSQIVSSNMEPIVKSRLAKLSALNRQQKDELGVALGTTCTVKIIFERGRFSGAEVTKSSGDRRVDMSVVDAAYDTLPRFNSLLDGAIEITFKRPLPKPSRNG